MRLVCVLYMRWSSACACARAPAAQRRRSAAAHIPRFFICAAPERVMTIDDRSGRTVARAHPVSLSWRRMECPDEESVLAFLDGDLANAARAPIEAHLAGCTRCARLV